MANNEVKFIHIGCEGERSIVDVEQYKYWDDDAHNTYIEFKCKKCGKSVNWKDVEVSD